MRRRKILHSSKYICTVCHTTLMVYSTANFLVLEPTALIYIYQKNGAVTRILRMYYYIVMYCIVSIVL